MVKTDIKNRTDIELLMHIFYAKIKKDSILKDFFSELSAERWQSHFKTMADFWENIVFFEESYDGSPLKIHQHLNKFKSLSEIHFNQWDLLFLESLEENFEGVNTENVKNRAIGISKILKNKIIGKL